MTLTLGMLGTLLFWRAGIELWQWWLPALAGLVLARQMPKEGLQPLDTLEWAGLGWLAWLSLGLFSSLDPAISAAQLSHLALLGALIMLLRRQGGKVDLGKLQGLFHALAAGGTLVFFAVGIWMGQAHALQGITTVGGSALPHHSIRVFFPNQNLFAGGVLAPAFLFAVAALATGASRAWLAALALYGAGLVYAGSRGAFFCLGAGLLVLGIHLALAGGWRRLRWPLIAALLLGASALTLPFSRLAQRTQESTNKVGDPNNFRRAEFWKGSLKLWGEHPLRGSGLGSFATAALRLDLPTPLTESNPVARYRLRLEHAHNEYLELLVETGLPGLLGLLLMLALVLRERTRPQTGSSSLNDASFEAALVSSLALALTDLNFHAPALLFWNGLWVAALLPRRAAAPQPELRRFSPALPLSALALAALLALTWMHRASDPNRDWVAATQVYADAHRLSSPERSSAQKELLEKAEVLLQSAETRSPYRAAMRLFHAQVLGELGRTQEADRLLALALQLEPNYARAWEIKARLALERRDRPGLRNALNRLHEIRQLKFKGEDPDGYSESLLEADWPWVEQHWKALDR